MGVHSFAQTEPHAVDQYDATADAIASSRHETPMPHMRRISVSSVRFFDEQFRRQLQQGAFALNPFEIEALPRLRGEVLDAGCGLGKLSLAEAERGCAVLALAASPAAARTPEGRRSPRRRRSGQRSDRGHDLARALRQRPMLPVGRR